MIQLRQTIRRLSKTPGFALTSVLTLAIGIGATVAIFSVVNGILIRPLPFPESNRLVTLAHRSDQTGQSKLPASTAIYFTYRDNNETFDSVALWVADTASVTNPGEPEEVPILETTHEFLPTLRVEPAIGRAFSAADDAPGAAGTVILSHAYWERRFGGGENVLGQTLTVDGLPRTVIGVMPEDFRFLQEPAAILLPMQPNRAISFVGPLGENGLARLKDGVTIADANADVDRMIPILRETFPPVPGMDIAAFTSLRLRSDIEPLKDTFVGDLDDVLWVLMGTIGMLLAIACANVANLHLVRTEGRGHELAIQAALGATRGKIARSLLLESLVIGIAGGIAGLALAMFALPVLLAAAARDLPSVLAISIDSNVLAFAFGLSVVSSVLFGLIPVVKYAAPSAVAALSRGGRASSAARERHRARNALVVGQVALALVLLVASGLMIRTLFSLWRVDPGFAEPDAVQVVNISIPQASQPDFMQAVRTMNDIEDRLAEVAGVDSVGFASRVPLGGQGPSTGLFVEGRPPEAAAASQREFRYTSPGFFATLGTPLVAGRTFEWADNYENRQVAVVSENLARAEWGSAAAALGKRLRMTTAEPWREIVGVVGDIRHEQLNEPAPQTFYLPLNHQLAQYMSRTVSFVIRSDRVGTPGFLVDIQAAIWSVDGSLPLASVQTLGNVYSRALARTSLTLVLLAITGSMALALGLVGIYGVVGYAVSQRTREIGIRMALGARASMVKRLFLTQLLMLIAVGAAIGLAGAVLLSRLMGSLLYGVSSMDPVTFGAVTAVLVATGIAAGYLPARHATRIDPMRALREE